VRLSIQKLYLALDEAFKKLPIQWHTWHLRGIQIWKWSLLLLNHLRRVQFACRHCRAIRAVCARRAPRISLNDDDDDDAILTCARKLASC